jgi:transposase
MRRLIDRCAGIDVGQALLVVCVRLVNGKGKLSQETRSFGATTPDLLELRDWLAASEVTHVAMESTGVYWKAPYYMLEDEFEVLLVNATHLKHVPGRKTDLLTELPGRAGGREVRGPAGLARFPRRDQRRGFAAAGAVRAGGAAVRVA